MRFRDLSRLWKLYPAWLLHSSLADRGAAGESLFDRDAPARNRQSQRAGQAPTGAIVVAVLNPCLEIWTAEFAPTFPAASFQSPAITSNVRDTAVAGEIMFPMRRPC